ERRPGSPRPRGRRGHDRTGGLRAMDYQPISGFWGYVAMSAKIAGIFTLVMITVAYATLAERRISAWIQDRRGPHRVGPFGLLQPIADGIKNILKEETLPATA